MSNELIKQVDQKSKTERRVQIALAVARFAKEKGFDLDEINPAFGPLIQLNQQVNIERSER
jgi:hypothetical protein